MLPAANATNYSDAVDLIDSAPGDKMAHWELEIAIEATPSLVDAKTVTVTVQDSADNATFADVEALAPIVTTGAGGAGAAAVNRKFPFPKNLRRFVRTKNAVMAAGGDNTAKSVTIWPVR